jgi:SAM-dependent methyltransferase
MTPKWTFRTRLRGGPSPGPARIVRRAVPDLAFDDPRLAALYDFFDADRSDLDVYLAIARGLSAHDILDLGCGTGTFALKLAQQGFEVTGADPARASVEIARAKPDAERVHWIVGDAAALPPLEVDLATMTGNVAQAITDPEAWEQTLRAVYDSLRPGGCLVFETRDPAFRGWEEWTRERTWRVVEIDGLGEVEKWEELTEVALPLVSFSSTFVYRASGDVLTSHSTLRFRERADLEAQLTELGYLVDEVRDAPDRPGREFVFFARRLG